MSTKRCRSLCDVSRHGANVEARCRCGRVAVLKGRALVSLFQRMNWPKGIELVGERLRCLGCGRKNPRVEMTIAQPTPGRMMVRRGR